MSLLDVSIVNVALPSIRADLGAGPGGIQWVVSGYALTFGLSLVAGGRLGDALGRRRMFLIALTGFVLTSALAGIAPSLLWLVVARLLQGLTGGLLTPQNSGLIQDLFHGPERGRAFGVLGATIGVSTAVGPIVGGLILAAAGGPAGWRWVFFVNLPIGVVALALALRLVPRLDARGRADIDVVGALLLGAAVLGVLFPLVQVDNGGLAHLWWLFPIAVVIGWSFLRWEHRVVRLGRAPLLDTRLFTETPGYRAGAGIGLAYFCGFSGVWLVFAVFFQSGLGYTPLESGLAVTPFAIGGAVAAAVAGPLVARWGRLITVLGLGTVGIGFAVVALVLLAEPAHAVGLWIAAPMALAGIGGGAVISPNTTLTLSEVPNQLAGVAGGVLQTGQRIGTAIGTATLAAVYQAVLGGSGHYPLAIATALFAAVAIIAVAFALAVRDWRADRAPVPAG
ncbi:MFS transporter [Actinokineospora inagensis]|uniref:MFS transporter n=1 Tax=Actinokineospora inagensis TaxID=103730 RepID=UPI000A014F57|nr:MFS transporter [Actinokineospora inagensis]